MAQRGKNLLAEIIVIYSSKKKPITDAIDQYYNYLTFLNKLKCWSLANIPP
jgi:hypothetical protein